jgi:asparagine synthetase B (glutamine-hydrolysing)
MTGVDKLVTEKNRIRRHYFDRMSGTCVDSIAQIDRRKSLCRPAIECFLHMGFVPGDSTLFDGVDCLPGGCAISFRDHQWQIDQQLRYRDIVDKRKYAAADQAELAAIGGDLFVGVVARLLGNDTPVVVPLSGGYDSRAILSALLEVTEARNIVTYTFGTPGTLDYEIGATVAKAVGVKHHAFDLTKASVTEEKLMRIAELTDGNADLFQPVYLLDIFERLGTDHVVWSGYTGDGVGGSHFRDFECNAVEFALRAFVQSESVGLLDPGSIGDEARRLIVTDSIYKDVLGIHEELFFANHVERLTTSSILPNHVRYAVPFMDDAFIQFIWGVPFEHRRGKTLFNQIWNNRYPEVFSLPLKSNRGLPLELPRSVLKLFGLFDKIMDRMLPSYTRKGTNYVSYRKMLRFDRAFSQLVEGMICSIRGVDLLAYGIDVQGLLRQHQAGVRDNSRALTVLASLGAIEQAFN